MDKPMSDHFVPFLKSIAALRLRTSPHSADIGPSTIINIGMGAASFC